jgi:FtsH-binding integral membrane protein
MPGTGGEMAGEDIIMGDTYLDPVDHVRTTRSHAGESMIDVAGWPGYLLLAAGLIAVVGCLAAFGTGHQSQGMTTGVIAIVALTFGLVWLTFEHRRVRRIEDRWYAAHPEVRRQRPAS